jgi:hypothetical protein
MKYEQALLRTQFKPGTKVNHECLISLIHIVQLNPPALNLLILALPCVYLSLAISGTKCGYNVNFLVLNCY